MFMFSTKDLKSQAKNNLEGKYFKYFLIMLVTTLLSSIPVFFDPEGTSIFFNIIDLVLSSAITLFLYRVDMNISLGKEDFVPKIHDIAGVIIKSIFLTLLTILIVAIGLIVFIVPGIIATFLFSQAIYVLLDDNSKSVIECLKDSKAIMKGNILNYIALEISFIPKIILGVLTLGIGFFWFLPQMQVATANFYFYAKENHK